MNPEQRQRRMLAALPLLLQDGANIGELFSALARVLSGAPEDAGMEYGVTRVLRSRWHPLADGWDDGTPKDMHLSELARLGALFGFAPAAGETAERFRRRLGEFIAIHRAGLTTASAILRLVALVYHAEAPPALAWPDERSVVATFDARDVEGTLRPVRVELIENPSAPASASFIAVNPAREMLVRNRGLDPAIPEIRLRPSGGPAHVPVLIHEGTGLRAIYVGIVKPGQTLTLRHRLQPLLDGIPQDVPVLLTNPYAFDAANAIFGPNPADARFSLAERDATLPALDIGENTWRYDTVARAELVGFLGAWKDLAPLAARALLLRTTPSADIELRWREAVPASLALRVPADFVPRLPDDGTPRALADRFFAFVRELEWALHYARAAGVRARVELALPHVSEVLELRDDLSQEATQSLGEQLPITENAPPPAPGIRLHDTLAEPADGDLSFGGHFDTTYFDTSLFDEAETEP